MQKKKNLEIEIPKYKDNKVPENQFQQLLKMYSEKFQNPT